VTHNYYLIAEDEIGKQSLSESVERINFDHLVAGISDHKQRMHLFASLSRNENPKLQPFFRKIIVELEETIKKTNDNDRIMQYLEYVEKFDHRVTTEVLRIVRFILNKKPSKPIVHKTRWGNFSGKSHADLEQKLLDILDDIRYLRSREVFRLLIAISQSSNEGLRAKAFKSIESMTKYNLQALTHIGIQPQRQIIEELSLWSLAKLLKHLDVVLFVAKKLFDASWEGTNMSDYQTLNIQWGALNATESLRKLRLDTIQLLLGIYDRIDDMETRLKVMKVLEDATRTPMRGRYTKDLENMILGNANKIIEWYLKNMRKMEPILLKEIDEQKEWLIQRYSRRRLPKMSALEKELNSSKDYQYFRILVGDDHGFSRQMKYGEIEKFRTRKIKKFIQEITKTTQKTWTRRIILISSYSNTESRGSFNYFRFFLHRLALEHPDFAIVLLQKHEKGLERFIANLIIGVCQSAKQDQGRVLLIKWIGKGKHLVEAATAIQCFKEADMELIDKVFQRSKLESRDAMNRLMETIGRIYKGEKELKKKYLMCVKELVKQKDISVVSQSWLFAEKLLQDLGDEEADIMVKALVSVPDVTNEADYTLKPIFQKYPAKFVEYFKMRVDLQKKKGEHYSYIAIPYDHMHELAQVMKPHKEIIFQQLKQWFYADDWFQSHCAAKLLFLLFNLSEFDKEMLELIRSKKDKDVKMAFDIIHAEGRGALVSKLTKEFIKYHHKNKKWMNSLMAAMSETGVVTGEDGLLNAYKHKREIMQEWRKDKSPHVRNFAEEYEKSLTSSIEHEKRRTDEELTLLKKGII
jgi:hypothetical protein